MRGRGIRIVLDRREGMRSPVSGWRTAPSPGIPIFICPRHEAGYTGHLLSFFQEPLMSTHRPPVAKRPDVPSAACLLCDRLALSTATARKSAEGPPDATYACPVWAPGYETLGCHLAKHPPRSTDPILSRFSFQKFGVQIWPWVFYLTFLNGLTSV